MSADVDAGGTRTRINGIFDLLDTTEEPSGIGLGAQLALFMAIFSLVPLAVTSYIGYTTSRKNIEQTTLWSLQNSADLGAVRTQLFFEDRRDLVSSLVAGNRDLTKPTRALARSNASTGSPQRALEDHITAKLSEADHAVGMYVLTEDRTLAEASVESLAETARERTKAACKRLGGDGLKSDLLSRTERALLVVRQRFLRSDDRPQATFCSGFRFAVRNEFRDRAATHLPESSFHLVDTSGRVVVPAEADRAAAIPTEIGGAFERAVESDRRWHGRYRTADDRVHYGAIAPVEETDLSVVATIPRASAMAPLENLRNRAFLLGAIFLAFVAAGIGYTVRRFVGPISELLDGIRGMEQGELEQNVEPRGPKDLAILVSHFNEMSSRVADLQGKLEERVEERTANLRRSEAFNEALLDSIDDNLVVVDGDRTISKANASATEMYGEAIVGETYHSVFGRGDAPPSDSPVETTLQTEKPAEDERVHRFGERTEIMDVETVPLPGRDEPDDGPALVAVTRPVTERKQRRAQLIHREKMAAYGLLATGYAHEIGNPVSSMKLQLRRARTSDDEEAVEEALGAIEGQIDRIERLLRQMSSIARRQEQEQHRVSVNRVVEDAVQLLRHDPSGRDVEFVVDLDESEPAVEADVDRLLQVLLNLEMNAVDAVEGRGRVHVTTERADGSVHLRVRDTGPGVAPEIRERMFEPDFTTKPAGEGTGLGLFVSSRLVEDLDGSLRYVETDEEGALFEVVLPVWQSD